MPKEKKVVKKRKTVREGIPKPPRPPKEKKK